VDSRLEDYLPEDGSASSKQSRRKAKLGLQAEVGYQIEITPRLVNVTLLLLAQEHS
jgi:hypothetical protein